MGEDQLEAVPDARRIRQLRLAVMTYHASANFGYFGTGGEGWWSNDAQNVALGEGCPIGMQRVQLADVRRGAVGFRPAT